MFSQTDQCWCNFLANGGFFLLTHEIKKRVENKAKNLLQKRSREVTANGLCLCVCLSRIVCHIFLFLPIVFTLTSAFHMTRGSMQCPLFSHLKSNGEYIIQCIKHNVLLKIIIHILYSLSIPRAKSHLAPFLNKFTILVGKRQK